MVAMPRQFAVPKTADGADGARVKVQKENGRCGSVWAEIRVPAPLRATCRRACYSAAIPATAPQTVPAVKASEMAEPTSPTASSRPSSSR